MRIIVFGLYVFLGMIVSLPIMLILKVTKKEEKFFRIFIRPYFKSILLILNVKVDVKGNINYPLGNVLIISNHLSLIDILVLSAVIDQRVIYVSKLENKNIPIISSWMKFNKTIFIDRKNIRQSIMDMNKTTKFMENNEPVLIFPQGTRSTEVSFKPGSLKFVQKSKGDILPIGLYGTNLVFKNKFSYKRKHVVAYINDQIIYDEYKEKNLVEVQKDIENKIKEQVKG